MGRLHLGEEIPRIVVGLVASLVGSADQQTTGQPSYGLSGGSINNHSYASTSNLYSYEYWQTVCWAGSGWSTIVSKKKGGLGSMTPAQSYLPPAPAGNQTTYLCEYGSDSRRQSTHHMHQELLRLDQIRYRVWATRRVHMARLSSWYTIQGTEYSVRRCVANETVITLVRRKSPEGQVSSCNLKLDISATSVPGCMHLLVHEAFDCTKPFITYTQSYSYVATCTYMSDSR
jgi:hypothetical protein